MHRQDHRDPALPASRSAATTSPCLCLTALFLPHFGRPSGFWLALAVAGVLFAHLVRRRARTHVVPFLGLWSAATGRAGGGLGSRIVRYLDLLLVALAGFLIAGAAGEPLLPGTADTTRDLVLVLDGGVGLRAADRLERLRSTAEEEIRRRAPGTRFVLFALGDADPRVLATTSPEEAAAFVRAQEAGWTDPPRGALLDLAREAAIGLRDPDLVLVTHRAGSAAGFRLRPVGGAVANAGVTAMEVITDPESGGRLARLTLRGQGPVEVEGVWSGEVAGSQVVEARLPPKGRVTFRVKAPADDFAPDDAAFLDLAEAPAPRLLVVSAQAASPFLAAALQALEATGHLTGPVDRTTPDRALEASASYDLLVFDRCAPPERLSGKPALYLAPPGGALPFRVGEESDAPALFTAAQDHPLLAGIDVERIPPRRVRAIFGGEVAVSAAPGPAIAAGPGWVAVGFDPDRCVFAASAEYPLFLRNAIEHLAPGASARGPEFFAIGEAAPGPGMATLEDGSMVEVGARLPGPPGFWRMGERTLAMNLLLPDLDLSPPETPADPLPPVGRPATPERSLISESAAAALALLLAAWWVYWSGPRASTAAERSASRST